LSQESWKKVTATLGAEIQEWGKAKELNHVMKNYAMFKHCLGDGGDGGGLGDFDYVAKRAERDSEACVNGNSVDLWGCELMLREVALSAQFAGAQILMKEKQFEEAERRLEALLQQFGEHFEENDSRTGLIIMTLGDVYTQSKRLTLAEGLYRNAAKLLSGPISILDDPTNQNLAFSCHPTCISLLEHSYSKLLKLIPKRDKEAESVLERAEGRWKDTLNSIEDASTRGIVDLQTQRLYYLD
jgi:tetratricopeptide (TPR) repeat protein